MIMASFRQRGRYWYYRYTDENGDKVEKKGHWDLVTTKGMAAAAEAEVSKIRAGYVDRKTITYVTHEARPLSEHLDAWKESLVAKGATPKHLELSSGRVRRIVAMIRGARLADIDPPKNAKRADLSRYEAKLTEWVAPARLTDLTTDRVQATLAALRMEGRSLQTCNHYRTAVKAFSKWCQESHRIREDALLGVKGYNAKEDRRHDRRTLSLGELTRLIEVTERGPTIMGLTGPARALCYRLAVATGLRYSEIATIRLTSFDWKAPSVRVAAAYTKNGQEAELPLPNDLAGDLRPYVATMAADSPLFPLPKDKGAEMLQVDLAAAGIAYKDESGLFFDFHSLRCQTATLADAAGVSPRVVQRLMRHSTLELTGRYTRPRAVDIESAASMLPSLKPTGDRPDVLAATGTDTSHVQTLAHHLPTGDVGNSRDSSAADVMTRQNIPSLTNEEPLVSKGFGDSGRLMSAIVGSTGEATRTPDLRIMRPQANSRRTAENKAKTSHQQTLAPHLLHDSCPTDPELAAIVDAWSKLPAAVKGGIAAMVKAAGRP
jgi:integrase